MLKAKILGIRIDAAGRPVASLRGDYTRAEMGKLLVDSIVERGDLFEEVADPEPEVKVAPAPDNKRAAKPGNK